MIDIQLEKNRIIRQIADLEKAIFRILSLYKELENGDHSLETNLFEIYKGQALQLDIDIDLLKEEQGYSSKNFFASLDNLDHDLFSDQTLDELLASLSA